MIEAEKTNSKPMDLTDNINHFRDAVFMEQEETRAIRTEMWLYIERINSEKTVRLEPELYELKNDPLETINLAQQKDFKGVVDTMSKRLHNYFQLYSNSKFDLWNAGTAKSNVANESFWKQMWGSAWSCTI